MICAEGLTGEASNMREGLIWKKIGFLDWRWVA